MTETIKFTVEASVLKVNGRRCTLAVFKQLPDKYYTVEGKDIAGRVDKKYPGAKLLGYVNYRIAGQYKDEVAISDWIVWTDGKKLYRGAIGYTYPRLDAKLRREEQEARDNQLFIGV